MVGLVPLDGPDSFFQDPGGNLVQFVIPGIILGMTMSAATRGWCDNDVGSAQAGLYPDRLVIRPLRTHRRLRHALKNALMPVVTVIGFEIPILIGGEVVIETMFALPGVGRYLVDAINQRDYSIISSVNLVIATTVLIMNLLIDVAYAWLDPRIQYS